MSIDQHGNSKKKEVSPDGSNDVNVFDIMQGVAVIVGVKKNQISEVNHEILEQIKGLKKWKEGSACSLPSKFKAVFRGIRQPSANPR